MHRRALSSIACSLARALDVMGDVWTPLILRDVFLGVDTFNDLAHDLGISRALLSARLDALVAHDVVREDVYQERPRRVRYALTTRGNELIPILVALTQWGDRWCSTDGAPLLFTHDCGAQLQTSVTCAHCRDDVQASAIDVHPGPGGRLAPGTTVVAQRLMARAQR